MKRCLAIVLALLMVCALVQPNTVHAETVASGVDGDITWQLTNDGTLTISGTGKMNDYDYQSPWDGYEDQIKAVVVENGVTGVGRRAFWTCNALTSVTLPESIISIGDEAFSGCSSLTKITIPSKMTYLGSGVFYENRELHIVKFTGDAPSFGGELFTDYGDYSAYSALNIFYPKDNATWNEEVFSEKLGPNVIWTAYDPNEPEPENAIYPVASGVDGEIIWQLTNDGTLTISGTGTGKMEDSYYGYPQYHPWNQYRNQVKKLVIEGSVTHIGGCAFNTFSALTDVRIEEGVISCGGYTFENCTSLTKIVIPDSLTSAGRYMFYECDNLSDVTLGSGMTEVFETMFFGCDKLTSIVIPNGVPRIEYGAFSGCPLTHVVIPASVTEIGKYAFSGYGTLQDVYYGGTKAQWDEITLEYEYGTDIHGNDDLFAATIHYQEDPIEEKLEDMTDSDASANVIREVVQSMDTQELTQTLKTDSAAVQNLADLEEKVGGAAQVRVESDALDMKEQEVQIVGANLNDVEEDKSAVLVIDEPAKKNKIPENCETETAVHFSMTLENVEETQQLAVPVKVTLPVPEQLNPEKVVVIHYHGKDREILEPAIEKIGDQYYASIVLEGFSDFAMAEKTHDHNWIDATCIAPKTCSVCGATEGKVTGHIYSSGVDGTCNNCGIHRETTEDRTVMHMFRMYDPNSGEHFYTGSTEERENLVAAGWNYEGVGFTFSRTTGLPVYRLYDPITGEHLYTMQQPVKTGTQYEGKDLYKCEGRIWLYEGIAFNSAYDTEVPQYRLRNPNATRGAYHFTSSAEERDNLIAAGWISEGICFYSSWK